MFRTGTLAFFLIRWTLFQQQESHLIIITPTPRNKEVLSHIHLGFICPSPSEHSTQSHSELPQSYARLDSADKTSPEVKLEIHGLVFFSLEFEIQTRIYTKDINLRTFFLEA